MGGTFNPIHLGHLHLAHALLQTLSLSEIRFIPAANPPHRDQPQTSAADRAAMVETAISGFPDFTLDQRELQRTGPSYSIDTLTSLKQEQPAGAALYWLMGSDAFIHLNTWHRWQELLDYCHIVVVQRPHCDIEKNTLNADLKDLLQKHRCESIADLHAKTTGGIYLIEVAALDISSTQIRQQLQIGGNVSDKLPAAVSAYIEAHQLYQANR